MTYKKQQWKTGEIITEGKLNHIEDGIYNTDGDLTESKTLFASNILDLQTNKANQSDVVSINNEITNISADLSAAEADILTKAAQADVDTISNEVDTLQTQVTTNANNIKSLQDNAVNKSELDSKQDKLTAGNNITIVDNIISATTSGGDVTLAGDNRFTGNNKFVGACSFYDDTWIDFLKVGTRLTNQQDKKYLNQSTVTAGDNITITETTDGIKIDSTDTQYTLPIASSTTLGGIKIGDNLSISDDGTLSATGGSSAPDNMVTTDTAQFIKGEKTFIAGKTRFNNGFILNASSGIKSDDIINPVSLFSYNSVNLEIGHSSRVTNILGSKIVDSSKNIILSQGNITAGDNISIENTDTGIKISSTSSGGGIEPEFYENEASGYLILNKLCIQWGYTGTTAIATNYTITLLKPYKDTNYSLTITYVTNRNTTGGYNLGYKEKLATEFTSVGHSSGSAEDNNFCWITIGYIS